MHRSYEGLREEARVTGVEVIEWIMRGRNRGFCGDGVIAIDKRINTTIEKACILAEELGHFHTTVGDILDQSIIQNRKQERRAREWAYNRLIPLSRIIDAHHARVKGRHDISEFLSVTEEFLQDSINRYMDKYGLFVEVDNRYVIMFEPLSVIERFEIAD